MSALYGAVEAGGTKFVCLIGSGPDEIRAETRFPTTTPEETLARTGAFFHDQEHPLQSIGIASFGPVDLRPASPTYGYITSTPKPGWANTDVVSPLRARLSLPVAFDTDVNGAALGEQRWGAAQDVENLVYVTVGTGIGGGVMANGQLLHGLLHPEMGHMRIPHDVEADPFEGICPYHGDCLEGLASGPALEARYGQRAESFGEEHPAWEMIARYLALACVNLSLMLSPQRIILGGGVMEQRQLFPLIRQQVLALLNGYVQAAEILQDIESYIVPPGLGGRAGVLGALALAQGISEAGEV